MNVNISQNIRMDGFGLMYRFCNIGMDTKELRLY